MTGHFLGVLWRTVEFFALPVKRLRSPDDVELEKLRLDLALLPPERILGGPEEFLLAPEVLLPAGNDLAAHPKVLGGFLLAVSFSSQTRLWLSERRKIAQMAGEGRQGGLALVVLGQEDRLRDLALGLEIAPILRA